MEGFARVMGTVTETLIDSAIQGDLSLRKLGKAFFKAAADATKAIAVEAVARGFFALAKYAGTSFTNKAFLAEAKLYFKTAAIAGAAAIGLGVATGGGAGEPGVNVAAGPVAAGGGGGQQVVDFVPQDTRVFDPASQVPVQQQTRQITVNITIEGDSLDTEGLARKLEPALETLLLDGGGLRATEVDT